MSDFNPLIVTMAANSGGPSDKALAETQGANRLWTAPVLTAVDVDSITCSFASYNEDGGTQVS